MMGFALAISCVDGHEERECEMGLQWRKTSRWKNDSYRLHLRYLKKVNLRDTVLPQINTPRNIPYDAEAKPSSASTAVLFITR